MCRTIRAADYVFDKCVLIHAVESAGIAEHNQVLRLIIRTFSDAVVDENDLISVIELDESQESDTKT